MVVYTEILMVLILLNNFGNIFATLLLILPSKIHILKNNMIVWLWRFFVIVQLHLGPKYHFFIFKLLCTSVFYLKNRQKCFYNDLFNVKYGLYILLLSITHR